MSFTRAILGTLISRKYTFPRLLRRLRFSLLEDLPRRWLPIRMREFSHQFNPLGIFNSFPLQRNLRLLSRGSPFLSWICFTGMMGPKKFLRSNFVRRFFAYQNLKRKVLEIFRSALWIRELRCQRWMDLKRSIKNSSKETN